MLNKNLMPEQGPIQDPGRQKRCEKEGSRDSSNYEGEQERAHNLIADLVKEKTVADPASVQWFGLSDTELIVNGQKQPEALQQKLKAKYGIHENYGLYYGPVKMTGTGVFIDNDK